MKRLFALKHFIRRFAHEKEGLYGFWIQSALYWKHDYESVVHQVKPVKAYELLYEEGYY